MVPMTTQAFPVIYSTLAPSALVAQVLWQYELESVSSCQFWHRGLSDVYLIKTATAAYILRVSHHHWRSRSEINFELELLNFLKQQQIPVAAPIKTNQGHLLVEIAAPEGKRYATLFPYAPGQVAVGDLNYQQGFVLGKTLAKIHQASSNFRSCAQRQPLTLEYLLDQSWSIIAPFFAHKIAAYDYLEKSIFLIKQQLQGLPTTPPYWVICWGDPHSGNAHFTADNQVTLFDFDQCGYGWRAFDIAKFWQVSLQTGMSCTIREAFLAGYQSVDSITTTELKHLQTLTQTAHIWMWAISLNSAKIFSWCRLEDSYFQKRLERLKRLQSKDWQLF